MHETQSTSVLYFLMSVMRKKNHRLNYKEQGEGKYNTSPPLLQLEFPPLAEVFFYQSCCGNIYELLTRKL